jgi:hypothetical protein
MRKNGGAPTWFISDQLGSTSLALDAIGNEIVNSRQKYTPFGETRSGSSPTDRQFTGQREETGLGSLYDFNARMYSPYPLTLRPAALIECGIMNAQC